MNLSELSDLFANFLTKFETNQWGTIFISLITFLTLIAVIGEIIKKRR